MKYIDIHAHVNFKAFDEDRDKVMQDTNNAGFGVINVASNMENAELAVEMTKKYEKCWAVVGLHPIHEGKLFDNEKVDRWLENERVVAVGECGLDYFHGKDNVAEQKKLFDDHVQLAIKHNKPIMLHTRPSRGTYDAYEDLLELIRGYKNNNPDLHFHLHFYAGGKDLAKKFSDLGCTFSFTGVITFTDDYDETIHSLPIDSIMSETDSPYVSPNPYRGNRNEPKYVIEVVKRIAELKNLPLEEASEQMLKNARRVFNLKY